MKIVWIIIFILVLFFLPTGIFPHLKIAGVFPNLILLSILSLTILQGWKKTLGWTIAAGLFLDFYSLHSILGFSVVALLVVSYLAYFLSQNILKSGNFTSLILIFLITIFLYNLLLIFISDFKFLGFIIGIIYNLVLSLPIFYGLKKIKSKA